MWFLGTQNWWKKGWWQKQIIIPTWHSCDLQRWVIMTRSSMPKSMACREKTAFKPNCPVLASLVDLTPAMKCELGGITKLTLWITFHQWGLIQIIGVQVVMIIQWNCSCPSSFNWNLSLQTAQKRYKICLYRQVVCTVSWTCKCHDKKEN